MLLLYRFYPQSGVLYRRAHQVVCHRTCSDSKRVKIGNVSRKIFNSSNPELVPRGYLPKEYSPHLASHLQWIMKKDLLGQDIFLIGLPGPLRRQIVFQYLEMTNREVEYVVLSRDTTESDLKQRREILSGTAHYEDQSAVRAALEGRVLVLDGVEKAERNVLPILNNLLENREVQLEDGCFLVSSERYDKLLHDHSKEVLDSWKLVRVSENFRVVALGLPVPQFRGNPLDPPFRSRFQAREIQPSFEEQLYDLSSVGQHIPKPDLKNLLALSHTLLSSESNTLGIPRFPVENLLPVVRILNEIPFVPVDHAVNWLYPYKLFLSADGQKSVEESLKIFGFQQKKIKSDFKISGEKIEEKGKCISYAVDFNSQGRWFSVDLPGSSSPQKDRFCNYIPNKYHDNVLSELLQTHLAHDFCIVGNKGCGKSTLVKKFASLLNYSEEMVMLYRDMTSRDLLQQRITNEVGDTSWRPSQLVNGAIAGNLVILDGLHRLHPSTMSILQRLIHDRELQLYDGSRLLRHDRYDAIKERHSLTDTCLSEKKVYRIHPSFRVIALAEPPKIGSTKDQWLTPELLSTFLFHSLRPLSLKEERHVIQHLVGPFSEKMETVLQFAHALRNSKDEALATIGVTLSTRQLTRIAQRLSYFPHENIHSLISQACLMKFLPQLTRKAMENVLESSGIEPEQKNQSCKQCKVEEGKLYLGNTCVPIHNPGDSKVKVPDILFYNNAEHMAVMEAMLQDFILGEHLLLVGNQGVGKNKIADRFLQLLNRPREYVQLHRDTTVQSLTQQPTVLDGKIAYEDSPLVKAVQLGHVLVVDEADKAPTHVTCILKALVESGEMVLSDGRCIVHHSDPRANSDGNIAMHRDFRMIVLANRPGFPFLGNDFFATLGDIFSCHAVDNPSIESEMAMLRKYGPDVPDYILMRLVRLFGELRSMSDQNLISYPYSTREVVNIVKHLQNFPEESLSSVLRNVFDFDAFSKEFQETLSSVFFKHGIPFGAKSVSVNVAKEFPLPKPQLTCSWIPERCEQIINGYQRNIKLAEPSDFPVSSHTFDAIEARCFSFSEQKYFWQLPLGENNIPLAIAVGDKMDQSDVIHIATANPISVFTSNFVKNSIHCLNLSGFLPPTRGAFKPEIKMVALTSDWNGWLLFHEGATNLLLLINPLKGNVIRFNLSTLMETAIAKISRTLKHEVNKLEMCCSLLLKNSVVFYSSNGKKLILMDFESDDSWTFDLPQEIKSARVISENELLLTGMHDKLLAKFLKPGQLSVIELKESDNVGSAKLDSIYSANQIRISGDDLCSVLNAEKGKSGTLMAVSHHHAAVAVGFPQSLKATEIYTFPRNTTKFNPSKSSSCILPKHSQVIQYMDRENVPFEVTDQNAPSDSGFLEVTDLERQTCSYIPFPVSPRVTSYTRWLADITGCHVLMCPTHDNGLITVDAAGFVRVWETEKSSLQESFQQWHKFVGTEEKDQLTVEFENNKEVSAPKHGKVDPTGAPHVGGNTWAGGTGGRDTAGLGGKGGPYRLDAGHTVYQLSDAEKNAVPPEVQRAAREMAQKAYKEKLKEIEMSEYDAKMYEQFSNTIKKQVQMLRVILDGLQAKSKERQWLKHQTSGELDDTRLIEGLTGEKSIYKRRGEQEPEMGSPQEKPKRLRLVVDVSGSMYRFNGHDSRLERQLESIVMLMEALEGYHDKFQYEIIGHSGEEFHLELSKFDSPPKNNKERLDILKKIYVHSQYCMSGDNTLPATKHAIETITNEEADEYFVIVMSDANFDRYGISPQSFGRLLLSDPKVNSFAIFVGSLGNQAQMLLKALPAGRGFVCLDTKNLPQVLQQIFTSALLREQTD